MLTALKSLLGFIIGLIIVVLLFVYSGVYNVAADEPHSPVVQWLMETTRTQSIALRDDTSKAPPDLADVQRIRRGAQSYAAMCEMCHLAPGLDPTPIHVGLNPQPPRLAKEAGHYSPESLFWIVKHGIKMTGMPAWGETHSDEELWDIVAFVDRLGKMTPQQYQELTSTPGGAGPAHGTHTHGAQSQGMQNQGAAQKQEHHHQGAQQQGTHHHAK
jgi:mono/diheme cytochrome c family protein